LTQFANEKKGTKKPPKFNFTSTFHTNMNKEHSTEENESKFKLMQTVMKKIYNPEEEKKNDHVFDNLFASYMNKSIIWNQKDVMKTYNLNSFYGNIIFL